MTGDQDPVPGPHDPARDGEPPPETTAASPEGPPARGTAAPRAEQPAPGTAAPRAEQPAPDPPAGPGTEPTEAGDDLPAAGARGRRRRDPLAAALIGVLTLLLGFAIAVQVRSTGSGDDLAGAREEDLVSILDTLDAREDLLRAQINEQRRALGDLNNDDSRSEAALQDARDQAEALGILNGTVAAEGPGLVMTIRDPAGEVRVADLLDAVQELRGAGAETMQIDGVRVGVSTAVTGEPGALRVDDTPVESPYEIVVIGSPQDLQTAMNIPGGVVDRVGRQGGTVDIVASERVVVDALRPLDTPQYAQPDAGDD